jgi:hypothetical protein
MNMRLRKATADCSEDEGSAIEEFLEETGSNTMKE